MAHEYGHFAWRNLENCLISPNRHASPACDRKNASSSMRRCTPFGPFVARIAKPTVTGQPTFEKAPVFQTKKVLK
jgi:hypothetical protein